MVPWGSFSCDMMNMTLVHTSWDHRACILHSCGIYCPVAPMPSETEWLHPHGKGRPEHPAMPAAPFKHSVIPLPRRTPAVTHTRASGNRRLRCAQQLLEPRYVITRCQGLPCLRSRDQGRHPQCVQYHQLTEAVL